MMDPILRKNFSYLFWLQVVNYLFPLALIPYLTRVLGSENFGKIAFAQAFVTYFILLTDFGFNLSATQAVVKVKEDKFELSRVFWSTTFSKIFLATISVIPFMILLLTVSKFRELTTLLLIAYSGVLSTILFPIWFFQGTEKMGYITWFNAVPRSLTLVFTFLLVKERVDFQLALLIQVAATLIAAITCSIFIYKRRLVLFYRPTLTDLHQTISQGWEIFASSVATNIYTTTNTVVLGLFASNAAVGVFAASEKIIRSIIPLVSSISQVTFPRINSYYQTSKEQALLFGSKILFYSFFTTLAIGILLLVYAPQIVALMFGLPQYQESITILRISSFIPLFAVCNGILAVNLLITFGLKKQLLLIVAIGGLFSLISVFPATILYKVNGVAFVALGTEILISVLLIITFNHYKIKLKIFDKENLRNPLFSFLARNIKKSYWIYIRLIWRIKPKNTGSEKTNFLFSIGIVTYLDRYDTFFKPLIIKLVTIFPDSEFIIAVNGYHDKGSQVEYLADIKQFLSGFKNVKMIEFVEPQSLSKLWNLLILNSGNEKILILNDDITLAPAFRKNLNHSGILNEEIALINRSWSHFLISKDTIRKIGWFDQRFPGVGNEDEDYECRLVIHNIIIKSFKINGLKNIVFQTTNFSYGKDVSIINKKYIRANKVFFDSKWESSAAESPSYKYVRIINANVRLIEGMETPNYYDLSLLDNTKY